MRCIRILGENAGMNGMIGGQVLDMGAEHRKISLDELRLLQKLKTGCLLRAACELWLCGAGCDPTRTLSLEHALTAKSWVWRSRLRTISSISREMPQHSENPRQGAASEKSTFPSLLGLENAESLRQS